MRSFNSSDFPNSSKRVVSVKTEVIARLHKNFEDFVHEKEGVEFWYGRDLKNLLGYAEWRNLGQVIGSS